ncbi:uncharacterized protein LOC106641544 isoform X2 [Copidosoma floridanum]|nr:uncharacterized protein LOC106641544 isoform X2 [Copidosoma floridanum]
MFKRLTTKARRHSAEDAGVLPNPLTLDEPPGVRRISEVTLGYSSRARLARKSCGDAYSPLRPAKEEPEGEADAKSSDYRLVTAVPAYIVEHEPEKQKGLGVWGLRRMSKKIDSFRRSSSREAIGTIPERPDSSSKTPEANNRDDSNKPSTPNGTSDKKPTAFERRFFQNSSATSTRSPSPFKSFFIRMGSTGMLNSSSSSSSKGRRSSQTNLEDKLLHERGSDKENLFRSCSTSQLNTSPTYVKGDDPSEGIDLRMLGARSEHGKKTVSCDNLSGRHPVEDEDVFEEQPRTPSATGVRTFAPYDYAEPGGNGGAVRTDFMRKSSSCDFKEAKKNSFPYAFLRSRLSVLPEERNSNGSGGGCGPTNKQDDHRLFKTASEEHFPAMKIEETFEGTTTLDRRRTSKRNGYGSRDYSLRYGLQDHVGSRSARNSYSNDEYARDHEFAQRYEPKDSRYFSSSSTSLQILEDGYHRNSVSLPYQQPDSMTELRGTAVVAATVVAESTTSVNLDLSYESTGSSMLRSNHQRRNSVPSNAEQRLSSHYVSSNESGYDSDGPRGESAASESLKCTDSSDTSSVVDSEIEIKPMRSSTPSEYNHHHHQEALREPKELQTTDGVKHSYLMEERTSDGCSIADALRWHQSSSGRLLPSIHQSNSSSSPSISPSSSSISSSSSSDLAKVTDTLAIQTTAHRVRLQQDKTRFLTDIIRPAKRVRRCRLIQLNRVEPHEGLGIRLAQQRLGELRYVVVQLESDGIAHRDGRLRLGDEIVEVEGKDLRTLSSLEEVQEFLRSCEGMRIRLKSAYEETVPQIYLDSAEVAPALDDYLERNLTDSEPPKPTQQPIADPAKGQTKRPDFLALDTVIAVPGDGSLQHQQQQYQYTTRHTARFVKGLGKPSLGFSVVGGRDTPRGEMGIFVKRVFPGGQADVSEALFQGDEILSFNGKALMGCTHQEVIELFKSVREGSIELELARRHR